MLKTYKGALFLPKRRPFEAINDIKEAMSRIITYTENMNYADFLKDFMTQDAVVRNLEIIGEAVKFLDNDFRAQYPAIP